MTRGIGTSRLAALACLVWAVGIVGCGDDDRGGPDTTMDGAVGGDGATPDAGTTGDDGGAETDGGETVDGGPEGPNPRLDTLVEEAATAVCDSLLRCCDAESHAAYFRPALDDTNLERLHDMLPPNAPLTEDNCTDLVGQVLDRRIFGAWLDLVGEQGVEFDEEGFDACLSQLEDASCGAEMEEALQDDACFILGQEKSVQRQMFRRTATEGSCEPVLDASSNGVFYGTCNPTEAFCCYPNASGDCTNPFGTGVTPTDGRCLPVAAPGESCSEVGEIKLCATGTRCNPDTGTCPEPLDELPGLGEACTDDCAEGWCDFLGDDTCKPYVELGESCSLPFECESRNCGCEDGEECEASEFVCLESTLGAFCATPVSVTIDPTEATIGTGAEQVFTATVTGASDTSVTWSVVEADGGTIDGGTYTAPDVEGTYTVKATSNADPVAVATATVTVEAGAEGTVSVSPPVTTVSPGGERAFEAMVSGFADTSVTWSVDEADGGSITAEGVYTAPDATGAYTVRATSNADDSISGTAMVTVAESSVSTLAGSTSGAPVDGTGMDAVFFSPSDVAVNADGDLLVADGSNDAIRVVTLEGVVTTLVSGAPIDDPQGIAVADDGTIYVANLGNHTIVKIVGTTATVLAGAEGMNDFADGTGSDARFNAPRGIAIDPSSGNLIVADTTNDAIRMVTPAGVVSTLIRSEIRSFDYEDGPVADAEAYLPYAVAVDADGRIFFAGSNRCVRMIADDTVTRVAGTCVNWMSGNDDGEALMAKFRTIAGLAIGAGGEILIGDNGNHAIRALSADLTTVTTLAGLTYMGNPRSGSDDGEPLDGAAFSSPKGLVSGPDGAIYIADSGNHRIRRLIP